MFSVTYIRAAGHEQLPLLVWRAVATKTCTWGRENNMGVIGWVACSSCSETHLLALLLVYLWKSICFYRSHVLKNPVLSSNVVACTANTNLISKQSWVTRPDKHPYREFQKDCTADTVDKISWPLLLCQPKPDPKRECRDFTAFSVLEIINSR